MSFDTGVWSLSGCSHSCSSCDEDTPVVNDLYSSFASFTTPPGKCSISDTSPLPVFATVSVTGLWATAWTMLPSRPPLDFFAGAGAVAGVAAYTLPIEPPPVDRNGEPPPTPAP